MAPSPLTRQTLSSFFDELLLPERFKDYGPNGLQIEGRESIERVAFAVSATADSIAKAIEWQADALVVHHGLFWQFHGPRPITGPFGRRVKALVHHDINLWGFHLPLDAHLQVGNAAGLARRLGLGDLAPFGDYKGAHSGVQGRWPQPISVTLFKERLASVCSREVWVSSPSPSAQVRSVGIVTGGGNRYWKDAQTAGLDAFVTGEMSEHDWNEAQEAGICYFAAGHHATERFGVMDLCRAMLDQFPHLHTQFIDSENPA